MKVQRTTGLSVLFGWKVAVEPTTRNGKVKLLWQYKVIYKYTYAEIS